MIDRIHTLDLHFQDRPQTIASYLLLYDGGGILVETGPGSTIPVLRMRLAEHGLTPADITDVLLTHIHLDHAGAAGWMAQHGATLHVHHVGAPHMVDPGKLLASAERIYGDDMDRLWGEFLPVPEECIVELHDGDTIAIGDLRFEALDTPGHAYHHMAYRLGDVCFAGDVGGVRLPGHRHVALTLPPPEIRLDLWQESIQKLRQENVAHLAPTHFGLYDDVTAHLDRVESGLQAAEEWLEQVMPDAPTDEELREQVTAWMQQRAAADGVSGTAWDRYETANPSWMAAAGLRRYWDKHKAAPAE